MRFLRRPKTSFDRAKGREDCMGWRGLRRRGVSQEI